MNDTQVTMMIAAIEKLSASMATLATAMGHQNEEKKKEPVEEPEAKKAKGGGKDSGSYFENQLAASKNELQNLPTVFITELARPLVDAVRGLARDLTATISAALQTPLKENEEYRNIRRDFAQAGMNLTDEQGVELARMVHTYHQRGQDAYVAADRQLAGSEFRSQAGINGNTMSRMLSNFAEATNPLAAQVEDIQRIQRRQQGATQSTSGE